MLIQNYEIALSSYRVYEQRDTFFEKFHSEDNDKGEEKEGLTGVGIQDRVSISDKAMEVNRSVMEDLNMFEEAEETDLKTELIGDAKIITLKRMIESITGRKINLTEIFDDYSERSSANRGSQEAITETPVNQSPERGLTYSAYQSHYEYESTSFSAEGTIITGDGHKIDFSLELEMSREFFSEEVFEMRSGAPLVDPLVVNYSGKAAELSDMKFSFDLNIDGSEDNINMLKPGRGFLVIDKNRDGVINDGSEMFGPSTGDGFRELAGYDEDKNNWIDENDSVYNRLALWNKSSNNENFVSLKDSGVGAIYLGSAGSDFDLKNQANELYGRIQRSGLFLTERGEPGVVQQLDFSL